MPIQQINIGSAPNDGTGDPIRSAFDKSNQNFSFISPTRPALVAPVAGYELVKDWDFKYIIRDEKRLLDEFHTRYYYEEGALDFFNDEWQRYRNDGNHVFTSEGLNLVARSLTKTLTEGQITSGMLRSKWSGKYGWYEAKVRCARGKGAWNAFWMYPFNGAGPLEIDVFEIVDGVTNDTSFSVHNLHGPSITDTYTLLDEFGDYFPPAGTDFAKDFHIFAVDWDAAGVRYYVDGVLIRNSLFPWQYADASAGAEANVFLNLVVGGGWPGDPQYINDFPMVLTCEYMRVWQPTAIVSAFGPELVFNGTFPANATGWATDRGGIVGWDGTNKRLTVQYGGQAFPGASYNGVYTEVGSTYRVQARASVVDGTSYLQVGWQRGWNQYNSNVSTNVNGTVLTFTFVATEPYAFILLVHNGTGTASWDDVSIKKQL